MATPHFYINLPFQGYPFFLAKFLLPPQVTQFLEGPTPPLNKGNVRTMWLQWKCDLNSLKPFKFKLKTNIGDINSSSSDDEEEVAKYKVKRTSNNDWCECSAKAFVGRCSSK